MKIKTIIGIIASANLVVGGAFAQNENQSATDQLDVNQPAISQPDAGQVPALPDVNEPAGAETGTFSAEKFLKESSKSGVMEVNMSQVGAQKAQDPELKEVAQKLVTDHSKLNDQLKELAEKKGITLSTEIEPKQQKMMDHLSGLSGAEFDKAFATHMVQGHKKSIDRFKQAAANTQDTEVSQLAKKALPTLLEHLAKIQKWAPDATAGIAVDEPAGAEKKSDELKNDSGISTPEYKSPVEPNDSQLPK